MPYLKLGHSEENFPEKAEELVLYFENHQEPVKPSEMFQSICLKEENNIYNGLTPGNSKSVKFQYLSEGGDLGQVTVKLGGKTIPLHSIVLSGSVRIDQYEDSFTSVDALKDSTEKTLIGQRIVATPSSPTLGTITLYETVNDDGSRKLAIKVDKKA